MARLKQHGFTFVEILIVLASLIFLFTIIAYTYDGIKARSRNDIRTADIRRLQVYIETFYSQNTFYPSRADLNSPSWEKANLKGFSLSYLADPLWKSTDKACTVDGNPVLLAKSQTGCFGYAPTNNGASCEKNDQTCDKYTLTATLEAGGGVYTKTQLD
jgi:Tfp pilus assembly protein PilE